MASIPPAEHCEVKF